MSEALARKYYQKKCEGLQADNDRLRETERRKTMAKKGASGEQGALMDVGPENLEEIVKEVRIYKKHQRDRLAALKKEVAQKDKIKALVKEAELQRLKGGEIKFEADNAIICVTPQDDLITIKEKTAKKPKKAMKDQVNAEEQQHQKGKKKK